MKVILLMLRGFSQRLSLLLVVIHSVTLHVLFELIYLVKLKCFFYSQFSVCILC